MYEKTIELRITTFVYAPRELYNIVLYCLTHSCIYTAFYSGAIPICRLHNIIIDCVLLNILIL